MQFQYISKAVTFWIWYFWLFQFQQRCSTGKKKSCEKCMDDLREKDVLWKWEQCFWERRGAQHSGVSFSLCFTGVLVGLFPKSSHRQLLWQCVLGSNLLNFSTRHCQDSPAHPLSCFFGIFVSRNLWCLPVFSLHNLMLSPLTSEGSRIDLGMMAAL